MVFGNSAVIFLHSLVLELLFDEIDIDVMMLFKFDFNHAVLNFKTIASMKFSFDLNLILIWSRNSVLFKWNVKNGYQKNLKKFSFTSLDRLRIPFDRSNRNRELIESSRDFVMNFFNFLIDWEFILIDRIFLSIDQIGIENRLSYPETSKWIY